MATAEERVNSLEQQVSTVAAKVDMLVIEAQQQREDIRQAQAKHDADMKDLNARIDSKFDSLMNQIQNMAIAAVVGFGAIAVAVGGIVFAALK